MVSLRQRLWNGFARSVERPLIALVTSQPLLRRVSALHAALTHLRTPDMRFRSTRLGAGGRSVPALWCSRGGRAPQEAVILYLHGGAYTVGGAASHKHWVAQLGAACGCRAALIDYRLAPEHPFPAALDDAETAYRALLAPALGHGRVVVMGDSAGGGLAFALLARIQAAGLPAPEAIVAFSPWVDLTLSGSSMQQHDGMMLPASWLRRAARMYAGAAGTAHPGVSPLFQSYASPPPPTLVFCGDREMLRDDTRRMADKLRAAGAQVQVDMPAGVGHIWPVHAGRSQEADRANDRAAAFVRTALSATFSHASQESK